MESRIRTRPLLKGRHKTTWKNTIRSSPSRSFRLDPFIFLTLVLGATWMPHARRKETILEVRHAPAH